MRIVHASNFGFKPVKGFLHATSGKLSNGWIRSGHHVVNFSERDVARWAGFGHRADHRKRDAKACKRERLTAHGRKEQRHISVSTKKCRL